MALPTLGEIDPLGILIYAVVGAQIWILPNVLINLLAFRRLQEFPGAPSQNPIQEDVVLSVLIPARNEAAALAKTLSFLQKQQGIAYEILVLDDQSTDHTAKIIREIAAQTTNLHLLQGSELPHGWTGKNWACHQLSQAARGRWLLFTDADVEWNHPFALKTIVDVAQHDRVSLLSIWPRQQTEGIIERMVVPLMSFALYAYLPVWGVHSLPFASMAAANGQGMLFERKAYSNIGGHQSIRSSVLDDVHLARHIKQSGYRMRMVHGGDLVACRMYTTSYEVIDGFAKNILAGHANSVLLLAISAAFHLMWLVVPWLLLGLILLGYLPNVHPVIPLALAGSGMLVRIISSWRSGQRIGDSLSLPVATLVMTWIAIKSTYWQLRYGGPQWKGRRISTA